jgi:hypothetical protein
VRDTLSKEKLYVPGPGNYQPNVNSNKIKGPSWRFGTSNKTDANPYASNPGPGNYNISKGLGQDAPKYSLTSKNNYSGGSAAKNLVPGPGQYSLENSQQTMTKPPTWKIGTASRDDNLKKVVREGFPGPGNYNSEKGASNPKYSFGRDPRIKSAYSDGPGPGQYKVPVSVFNVPTFVQGSWDKSLKFV